jgi:cytochrome c oxidase cbb3-type subunit 3
LIDENSVELSLDAGDIASGKEIFITKCAACHGQQGEGGVGPNFADKYWIHGGDINSLFKTIKYGVPSKGMISWQSQLSPKEMQQVSSFIITLEGTNPPNQKEPQGELYDRDGSTKNETTSVEAQAGI